MSRSSVKLYIFYDIQLDCDILEMIFRNWRKYYPEIFNVHPKQLHYNIRVILR